MIDLTGVHVPAVTPFRPDGAVDEEGIRRLTDFWVEHGVRCLVPTANNGELPHLTIEERQRVWKTMIEAAGGRAAVFPCITSNATAEVAALARFAEELHADGVMVAPPFYFRMSDEELARHYEEIAAATRLPIMIHNEPWLFKLDVRPSLVNRLSRAGRGNICFIKESTDDSQRVSEILSLCGERMTIVVAGAGVALEALFLGAQAWMTGLINFLPGVAAKVVDLAVRQRRLEEARKLYFQKIWPVHAMLKAVGRPNQCIKYALTVLGLPAGNTRPPLLPLSDAQKEQVLQALSQIGALPKAA